MNSIMMKVSATWPSIGMKISLEFMRQAPGITASTLRYLRPECCVSQGLRQIISRQPRGIPDSASLIIGAHTKKSPAGDGGAWLRRSPSRQKLTVVVALAVMFAVWVAENARLVAPAVSSAAQVAARV